MSFMLRWSQIYYSYFTRFSNLVVKLQESCLETVTCLKNQLMNTVSRYVWFYFLVQTFLYLSQLISWKKWYRSGRILCGTRPTCFEQFPIPAFFKYLYWGFTNGRQHYTLSLLQGIFGIGTACGASRFSRQRGTKRTWTCRPCKFISGLWIRIYPDPEI
jgi:hypothetical protein